MARSGASNLHPRIDFSLLGSAQFLSVPTRRWTDAPGLATTAKGKLAVMTDPRNSTNPRDFPP
jgi:hypothetical protein